MPSSSRRKILVVEDHPDVSEMMLTLLRLLGHEATAASTVKETEDRVARETFDLLLVDYRLPDGKGSDVLKSIAAPTRAVLLTAYREQELSPSVRRGFAGCLSKPVDIDALDRAIRTTCGE